MKEIKLPKILFAGEGGQGVQTIAEAFALAAGNQGFKSTYIPSFGVEQRGTPSVAYVIIGSSEIAYPRFEIADVCVVLSDRAIDKIAGNLSLNTEILFDSSTIDSKSFKNISQKLFALPATKYAKEKFNIKSYNVIMLGALIKHLKLDKKYGWESISKILAHKFIEKSIEKINKDAFDFGSEIIFEKRDFSEPIYKPCLGANIYKSHGKTATILPKYCKGCLICVLKCPVYALKAGKHLGVFSTPVPTIDLEKCIVCGKCRNFCPDGAIGVDKIGKK
jgi:2-oxoglutarate ferredoxin oxidoreductase subunit gamma